MSWDKLAIALSIGAFFVYCVAFTQILHRASEKQLSAGEVMYGIGDSAGYQKLAEAIIETGSFHVATDPTLSQFRTPGYPAFVAVVYFIFHTYTAVAYVQYLLASISILLAYYLGKQFGGPALGFFAALFFALDPSVFSKGYAMLTETLFVTLFLASLAILVNQELRDWEKIASSGFLLGIATLVRPIGMYLVPPYILYVLLVSTKTWRSRLLSITIFLLAFLLCIVPWMARNKIEYGSFSLSSNGPFIMLLYNIAEFERYHEGISAQDARRRMYEQLGVANLPEPMVPLSYFASSSAVSALAFQYLQEAPIRYFLYHSVATIPFFLGSDMYESSTEIADTLHLERIPAPNHSLLLFHGKYREFVASITHNLPELLERLGWLVLLVAGALEVLRLLFSRAKTAILGLFFLALIGGQAMLVGPQSQPRYRLPVAPLILILGGAGVVSLIEQLKRNPRFWNPKKLQKTV